MASSLRFEVTLWNCLIAWTVVMMSVAGSKSWSEWSGYESISGPRFWGLINKEWTLCTRGKCQSPIDIDHKLLLFDPNFEPLNIIKSMVSGLIVNTGQDLTMTFEAEQNQYPILTGGPLTYKYRLQHLTIHFGKNDEMGSEHKIGGVDFPIEIQLVAFNEELFLSYDEAQFSSFGITVVSILGKINSSSNDDYKSINQIRWVCAV